MCLHCFDIVGSASERASSLKNLTLASFPTDLWVPGYTFGDNWVIGKLKPSKKVWYGIVEYNVPLDTV